MKKEKIEELLNSGYEIKVFISPCKKYEKGILSTLIEKEGESIVYPVYYNHVKKYLNQNQVEFIDTFNRVKNWGYREQVEMNIKSKSNNESKQDIQNRLIFRAINRLEYIEQY